MVGGLLGRLRAPADPARLSVPRLSVAGVTLERAQEPLHLLAVGSTGTGKTTLMTELMDGLVERGDRLIVVDPNGSYLSAFHRDGDTVLNPFDSRSPGWSPFTEVRRAYDFDKLARSIVPDGHGPDAAWHFFGQTLVSAVMRSLREDGHGQTETLLRALTSWPADKLKGLVVGTAAEALFDASASRALASTRFIVSSHLKAFEYLRPGNFSLRDWLHQGSGSLFMTWREDMTAALAPLVATWVDVLCTATLSMPPDPSRRIWLLVDELASLGKLSSLEAALTKGRKHGLCCVAGLQSTAQLDRVYGVESARVLRSCFRHLAVFALAKADPDTAEAMSRSLGEREVERAQTSQSAGLQGRSHSVAVQRVREPAVLASELTEMADLHALLCLSSAPARRVVLAPRARAVRVPAMVEMTTC